MLRFGIINAVAASGFLFLWLCDVFLLSLPWWSYLILAMVWITLTSIGSFHIRWNYHIDSLNARKKNPGNHIALSFDDGPHPEFTPRVIALLEQYDAKATFFCIGQHALAHGELVQRLISNGHTLGNHTYSHSNAFGFFGTEKVVDELLKTNAAIEKITGKQMKLYRPAFGVTNPNIKKALKKTGMQSIGWNVRSLDTTNRSQQQVFKRIMQRIAPGDVILLHDTSEKTVAVLEQLLLFLKERNLRSVTVDQLFDIKAYA